MGTEGAKGKCMKQRPLAKFKQGIKDHFKPTDDFSIVEPYDADRDLKMMEDEAWKTL